MGKRYAIIVAGGQGLRMGGEVPKQFMLLAGRPVLAHTLGLFAMCEAIVLALPHDHIVTWEALCREYGIVQPHTLCVGGDTRYASVCSALGALRELGADSGVVAIHDGVRPLASPEVIELCYSTAEASGAALPTRPVVESLRRLDGSYSHAVDRASYVSVQTPQTFELESISKAYSVGYAPHFTDDASVWEAYYPDRPITLVRGNVENIKLTSPQDMYTAERLLNPI